MTPRPPSSDAVDAYLQHVAALIAEHGHALQGVFGGEPVDNFTYTVGLTDRGLPELWIGSIAFGQVGPILNDLARNVPPEEFVDGALIGGDRFTVAFRVRGPVDVDAAEVNIARQMYPLTGVRVLQVLWPDPDGRYPDDDGYDQGRWPQRLLPRTRRPVLS